MRREAAARPARALRADQLAHAMEARGVQFARKRQVLAEPIGAAYCETLVSQAGLGLSLCEFGDDVQAARGAARSRALFDALIPGRTLQQRENGLLTLTPAGSERAREQAALARRLFAELPPSAR